MKVKEAQEKLKMSEAGLWKLRKKLGILTEKRAEITEEELKLLKKHRSHRAIPSKYRAKKVDVKIEKVDNEIVKDRTLKILDSEPIEVRNLKTDYNQNLKLIKYMQGLIEQDVSKGELPDKYYVDTIEKYQKLNITIINAIQKLMPIEDSIQKELAERLSKYGS